MMWETSIAAARNNEGFVVEPQPVMPMEDVLGDFKIAAALGSFSQAFVLDLGDIDGGIPGRKQGGRSDRACDLVGQGLHVITEDRPGIGVGIEVEVAAG